MRKAKTILFILEVLEALESSFIVGLVAYLHTVIKISYMLDIMTIILVISLLFLVTSIKGIYDYCQNYSSITA